MTQTNKTKIEIIELLSKYRANKRIEILDDLKTMYESELLIFGESK